MCRSVKWSVNSRVKRVLSQKGYQAYFISELPILNETKTVFDANGVHISTDHHHANTLLCIFKEQPVTQSVDMHVYGEELQCV